MVIKKFADLKEKDKLYLKDEKIMGYQAWRVAKTDKERRRAYGEFLKNQARDI